MPTTVEEIEKEETSQEKKDELLLDSLEIKGYRCFEHLTIEKLGRVNLIVGKNNVGKTALLEALWIYSRRGRIDSLLNVLLVRDEVALLYERPEEPRVERIEDFIKAVENIFSKRPRLNLNSKESVFIGSKDSKIKISTSRLMDQEEENTPDHSGFMQTWGHYPKGLLIISTLDEKDKETRTEYYSFENQQSYLLENLDDIPSNFVQPQLNDNSILSRIWDIVVLRGLESKAIEFMQLLHPNLEYINFVGRSKNNGNRYPIASTVNNKIRVPLKSFGEGMTRLLRLSMAFVQCQNGMLLIDEIESGLHYSVLPDVWKLIFKTAKDLNVQVFATTHSKDCIEAFAQAAYDSPEEGMLIRLERQGEKIVAKTIEEEMLVDAVNYEVEVR